MSDISRLAGPSTPPVKTNGEAKAAPTPPKVVVIPYNASVDPEAHKFLPWLWNEMKTQGLVSLYFPGQENTGFANFVKLFSGGENILLVVVCNEEGLPAKAMGFATWNPMQFMNSNAAVAGFVFFKEFWDHIHSDEAARRIMDFWFNTAGLDVVLGIIAEKNTLAKRFVSRLGWVHVGEVPQLHAYQGKQCDASIWYMTKDMFKVKGVN